MGSAKSIHTKGSPTNTAPYIVWLIPEKIRICPVVSGSPVQNKPYRFQWTYFQESILRMMLKNIWRWMLPAQANSLPRQFSGAIRLHTKPTIHYPLMFSDPPLKLKHTLTLWNCGQNSRNITSLVGARLDCSYKDNVIDLVSVRQTTIPQNFRLHQSQVSSPHWCRNHRRV